VTAAHQTNVIERVRAAHGERMQVVVLEAVALGAPPTGLVPVATATAVALEDRPPYGCGDVTSG
jgi:hypothetical protein